MSVKLDRLVHKKTTVQIPLKTLAAVDKRKCCSCLWTNRATKTATDKHTTLYSNTSHQVMSIQKPEFPHFLLLQLTSSILIFSWGNNPTSLAEQQYRAKDKHSLYSFTPC